MNMPGFLQAINPTAVTWFKSANGLPAKPNPSITTQTLRDEAAQRRLCQTLGLTQPSCGRFRLCFGDNFQPITAACVVIQASR